MKLPLVTVLMPVYNAERYLEFSIESILNQTFSDFEFIIINDGSSDNSLDIIKSYADKDNRIKVINRKNKGLVKTLNEGVKLAAGKYIARMDGDDISMPERLEKQFNYMERHRQVGIVGGYAKLVDINNNYIDDMIYPISNYFCKLALCNNTVFAHPAIFIRRQVALEFTYSALAWPAEDYELWMRISKIWKMHNIPEFLLRYRISDESISSTNKTVQASHSIHLSSVYCDYLLNKALLILATTPLRRFDYNILKQEKSKQRLADIEIGSLRKLIEKSKGINRLILTIAFMISFILNPRFFRTYLHNLRLLKKNYGQ